MRFHQKDKCCLYNPYVVLLPITNTLFVKKPDLKKSTEENTLDFHLDMIKKIDALLELHDKEALIDAPAPKQAVPTMPQPVPVEVRSPLEKQPEYIELEFPHGQGTSFPKNRILPEEFKIDASLNIEPEFKFITHLDSDDSIMRIKPQDYDRVEVIDLREFNTNDIPSRLDTIIIADPHIQQKLQIKKPEKNNSLNAATHNEDIKKKEHIYYSTEQKNKKNTFKQNNNSDELEKEIQLLQKQLQTEQEKKRFLKDHNKEEQQKQEQKEKRKKLIEKQLEQGEQRKQKLEEKLRKKLEKAEQKRHKLEEKIKIQLEKEQQKLLARELKQIKSKEKKIDEEKEEPAQEAPTPVVSSLSFAKKQLKEQRRLDRLAARQAIFEARLKIKKEKRLLKERKKHLELMQSDTIEKYTPEPMELDEDMKKILKITDELLGELPEEVINRFMRSDEFDLYERILNKYKIR